MPSRRDLANAIRALSMDAVQKANSGHPGAPMGMADIAEVLWRDVLKFNPGNPNTTLNLNFASGANSNGAFGTITGTGGVDARHAIVSARFRF